MSQVIPIEHGHALRAAHEELREAEIALRRVQADMSWESPARYSDAIRRVREARAKLREMESAKLVALDGGAA